MNDPVKFWQGYDSWSQAEQAWDARAAELAGQLPLKTFRKNPNLPGIRPNTRRFLAWKSLSYLHRHDHSGKLRRYFWRHPLRHGVGLLKNLLRGRAYGRDGDFFLYGITDVADFVRRLEQPNAVLVVGFSYCHKPFECPEGRFTDRCIRQVGPGQFQAGGQVLGQAVAPILGEGSQGPEGIASGGREEHSGMILLI